MNEPAAKAEALPIQQAKPEILKQAASFALKALGRLGTGFVGLLKSLKTQEQDPAAMLQSFEDHLAANQTRRQEAQARYDRMETDLRAKVALHGKVAPSRRALLERELLTIKSGLDAAGRELTILLGNERSLMAIEGKVRQMLAYRMAGVTEDQLDDIAIRVDEDADEAQGIQDATRDLERVGGERQVESDRDALSSLLADYAPEAADATLETPSVAPESAAPAKRPEAPSEE